MSDYEIRQVDARTVQGLRLALLHTNSMIGDADPTAGHTGILRDDRMIGCASIHPEPMPQGPAMGAWRIHGVAVEHGHRGLGLGGRLVERSLEHAAAATGSTVWALVPAGVIGFFQRFGFVRAGDPSVGGTGPEYLVHAAIRPAQRSWAIADTNR